MSKSFKISFLVLISSIIFFTSCKEKKICAAYNSYFVYDASNNGMFFTSIGSDSIPGERSADRFSTTGLAKQSGARIDKKLENINIKELKKGTLLPDTSLMVEDDSAGAVISEKELFPEMVNTDQEAYEHYVGELMKKYQKEKSPNQNNSPLPDSVNVNSKPPNMTAEEKAIWKQEKKDRKAAEKEAKKKAKEDALKEEEGDEFDEFDLDF